MPETLYDTVVIGGGSGGYASARTCAAGGLKTAVVEGGEEVGGLCILRGCMPTKALLYAAEVLHQANSGSVWGLNGVLSFDFARVMERKDRMIGEFASYRQKQLGDGRFAFYRSYAEFIDPFRVQLASGEILRAKTFILTVGSKVAPSPLPALSKVGFINSDQALTLKKIPRSLIVLGAGAVSLEFAQFFSRFGVEVTVLQRSGQILRDFDSDAAWAVTAALKREGMNILTDTQLLDARIEGGEKIVVYRHMDQVLEVRAEEIFFGLGRVPNTSGLGLEKAGVQTEFGRIITNPFMQTTADHIYAAGDCTGPYEIVHIAIQQGELAAKNILNAGDLKTIDYRLMINVVFTDPALATVGLTESQAISQGAPFLNASYPFNDHGKSMIMNVREGFVKLLAHRETGEILGGSCVGPSGGDLIHEIVVAMSKRMTVSELAAVPHYHPTLAEIWTYPAEELADQVRTGQPARTEE